MVFVVLALLLPSSQLHARDKSDVLYMKNGDKITCEIKHLERGTLTVKIDYMIGNHMVDWNEVERIESEQGFQVLWEDGGMSLGTLKQELVPEADDEAEDPRRVVVSGAEVFEKRPQEDVVMIEQLGRNFFEQLDIGIGVGFNFLSDNNQRQTTIQGEVSRLSRKRWLQADVNSFLTRRSDTDNSSRSEGKVSYLHLFRRAWFAGGGIDFLQSDQLDLDLRTTLSGLGGRLLIRRPKTQLAAVGGMVLNRERYSVDDSVTNSAEAVGGVRLNRFQFDSTELRAQALVYPSLSDGGRVRIVFDTSVYLDLWGDLYVKFNLFENFDSRPPISSPKNDFGGATTIGWTF